MRSTVLAALLIVASSTSLAAQAEPAAMRGTPGAQHLLARTGELQLTDAQVVRLAAIARRSAARRQSMRASLDSVRSRYTPGTRPDSATRSQLTQRLRADAERMRDQERTDRRDAIAVLTVDQQARAWEMVTNWSGGERGMRRPAGQRMRQMRGGRESGFGPDRRGPGGRDHGRPMRPRSEP